VTGDGRNAGLSAGREEEPRRMLFCGQTADLATE
jgi:hypothetical protein